MRELYALVFSVCVVLIGTEMIVRLFPEKSGSLIHALAALMLLVVLVNGILKLQSGVSLDFDLNGRSRIDDNAKLRGKGHGDFERAALGAFEKCGDGRAGSEYRHLVHAGR